MSDEFDNDTEKAVKTATDSGTFDALDFFSGASLPEANVTLYQDTAAAYRLNEIRTTQKENAERERTDGLSITDDIETPDEDELTELSNRLSASAVTFNLRAIAPAARNAIERKARASNPYSEGEENVEYFEEMNANIIAKSIVAVKNAKGMKDSKPWDAERVKTLTERLEPSEYAKLYTAAFRVNFVGDAIDRAVNADF